MGKRSTNQLRVFAADGGFQVIRRETREHAELLVMQEMLRPEFDQRTGELLGYRVLGAELRKVDSDMRSMRSSITISAAEMELNCERSRTEKSSEAWRRKLEAKGFPPEDRVERVRAKVRVYAVIGGAKGDILRVWPKR